MINRVLNVMTAATVSVSSLCTADAKPVAGLAPVVVQVTDGDGSPVDGAFVSVKSEAFERLPSSDAARDYRSTDTFGAVLVHIPYSGIKGERVLRGTLSVEKAGYVPERLVIRQIQELAPGAKKYQVATIEVELAGSATRDGNITAADIFKHLEEGRGMFDDVEQLKQVPNPSILMGTTLPSAEDAIPSVVRQWLSPQSSRVTEMCWWRQKDRSTRLMILALHYTSRGDTDISFFTRYEHHTGRFSNREAIERAEEVKLVTENRPVFAAALQRFYKKNIGEEFEIYRGESVDYIAGKFDGDLDEELGRISITNLDAPEPPE